MNVFLNLLLTCIALITMDMVWFRLTLKNIYEPTFLAIQNSPLQLKLSGGILSWLLIAVGIQYFAKSSTTLQSFYNGLLLGFVIYGVYNTTNYATLKNYPIKTALLDTLWGTFAVGVVSGFIHYF